MEDGFVILGGILVFMIGYLVGTAATIAQWDSIISTYKNIIANYREMLNEANDNYIGEIRAHANTINKFNEEMRE